MSENGDDFRLLPGIQMFVAKKWNFVLDRKNNLYLWYAFRASQEQSCFQPQSNRPFSLISRSQKRFLSPQRRWNPIYNENIIHQTPVEPERNSVMLSENECFAQYICNVLTRFPVEKQRKCRNELLRVILKYDISDCKISSDTTEQWKLSEKLSMLTIAKGNTVLYYWNVARSEGVLYHIMVITMTIFSRFKTLLIFIYHLFFCSNDFCVPKLSQRVL